MTPSLVVQPEAVADLDEAFHWYDAQRAGLGQEFLDEVSRAFVRIAKQPLRYALVHREARRALLRRFPYAVFYIVRDGRVIVLAVLHQRRNPRVAQARARIVKAE